MHLARIQFSLSAHGTHIGHIRLENKKPQQVPIDSEIHFGASTRIYVIRERPQPISGQVLEEKDKRGEELEGGLLGLPETETELDVSCQSLVEFYAPGMEFGGHLVFVSPAKHSDT